jgi:hypothetical protein
MMYLFRQRKQQASGKKATLKDKPSSFSFRPAPSCRSKWWPFGQPNKQSRPSCPSENIVTDATRKFFHSKCPRSKCFSLGLLLLPAHLPVVQQCCKEDGSDECSFCFTACEPHPHSVATIPLCPYDNNHTLTQEGHQQDRSVLSYLEKAEDAWHHLRCESNAQTSVQIPRTRTLTYRYGYAGDAGNHYMEKPLPRGSAAKSLPSPSVRQDTSFIDLSPLSRDPYGISVVLDPDDSQLDDGSQQSTILYKSTLSPPSLDMSVLSVDLYGMRISLDPEGCKTDTDRFNQSIVVDKTTISLPTLPSAPTRSRGICQPQSDEAKAGYSDQERFCHCDCPALTHGEVPRTIRSRVTFDLSALTLDPMIATQAEF